MPRRWRRQNRASRWGWPASTVAAVVLAIGALAFLDVFQSVEARLSDRLFLSRAPRSDIVIVAIDDASLQAVGRWPWPRRVHAELIGILKPVEPAVVAFDVAFFESSSAADDEALAKAIASVPTVLTVEAQDFTARQRPWQGSGLLQPILVLRQAARALGHAHTPAQGDGVVRVFPDELVTPEGEFPPFALAAIASRGGRRDFKSDRINFVGPPGTIKTVSYADVLAGHIPAEQFRDAFVFVGATAPSLHDTVLTPSSRGNGLAGVELHAQIAEQVLRGLPLRVAPKQATVGVVVALGLLIAFTFPRGRRLRHAALVALVFGLAYNGLVLLAFSRGLILNIFWPNVTIMAVVVAMVGVEYLAASRERRFIRETFSRYVSPEVVAHLLEHPEHLRLGGEVRTLTILFSDIRSFTSISERLAAGELTQLLNRYLTAMSAVILQEGGVLDKYIGDAIMAFWGAPIPMADHAARAVRAALGMQKALEGLNAELAREGKPKIAIGIGINTGEVVVGNMGSQQRFDYTVIGDAVNLASRLEGLNKIYGTMMLVSAETERELPLEVFRREVDRVAVKGKSGAVTVFELMSGEEFEKNKRALAVFAEALEHYRAQRWDEAEAALANVLALRLGDGPSEVFLKRIKVFRHNAPLPGWDGSWQAETK
ncbi:adenylate/guanylate cyclase domain-containing protein [Candidatus Parcubacteria bacterium]|nr:adenylate/guanylate cyclase domain-containing protein [Candidatus Parcubacteria bacterium]